MPKFFPIAAFIFVGIASSALPVMATSISALRASSEKDEGKPRTSAYNAIDGNARTSWCSSADDPSPSLTFTLKDVREISKIGLIVGVGKDGDLVSDKRSLKKVKLSDGTTVLELTFQKSTKLQEVVLDPPLRGTRITFTVTETRGAGPFCLPELSVKSLKGQLTGSSISRKVRALSTPARRFLGSWTDNVDAPERTIVISLDGTFHYRYEPLLEEEAHNLRGKWRGSYKRLTLERGTKKASLKAKVTDETLQLTGKGLTSSMASEYVRVP